MCIHTYIYYKLKWNKKHCSFCELLRFDVKIWKNTSVLKFCTIHGTEVGMFRSGFGWIAVHSVEYLDGGGPSHFSLSPGVKNYVKNKCFVMREGLCSQKANLARHLFLPTWASPTSTVCGHRGRVACVTQLLPLSSSAFYWTGENQTVI